MSGEAIIGLAIGAVLGLFGSFLASLVVENLKLPRHRIMPAQPTDIDPFPQQVSSLPQRGKFLNVRVCNELRAETIMAGSTANRVTALIHFYPSSGKRTPIIASMPGRWAGTLEPIPVTILHPEGNQLQPVALFYDPFVIESSRQIDIEPGTSQTLNIAARFDADVDCYGWCNENYHPARGWRDASRQIPPGVYRVVVEVFSPGVRIERELVLYNNDSVDRFRLEPLRDDDLDC